MLDSSAVSLKVPLCEAAGKRANPQEVLYPMLHRSRFFPRVYGVGFSADARRALYLSEFIEGTAPLYSSRRRLCALCTSLLVHIITRTVHTLGVVSYPVFISC